LPLLVAPCTAYTKVFNQKLDESLLKQHNI
jgi:hypothetical protein